MSLHVWTRVGGPLRCTRCGTLQSAPADTCTDHGHEWDWVDLENGAPCTRCGRTFDAAAHLPCTASAPAPDPAQEITTIVGAAIPAAPARELTAIQAVEQIRAWHEALRSISAVAEVRVLEACWTIRREHPERADFNRLVGGHLDGILEPDRAWLMAETWEASRHSKRLRDATVRDPDHAIAFVREFVETGHQERLRALDDGDREVISILTDRPSKRRARIRALIETYQESLDLGDGDDEPEPPPPPPPPPGPDLGAVLREFDTAVVDLLRVGGSLARALDEGAPTRAQVSRLVLLTDQAIGAMENASEAVDRAEERLGGAG